MTGRRRRCASISHGVEIPGFASTRVDRPACADVRIDPAALDTCHAGAKSPGGFRAVKSIPARALGPIERGPQPR